MNTEEGFGKAIQLLAQDITKKLDLLMTVGNAVGSASDSLGGALVVAMIGLKGVATVTMKRTKSMEPTAEQFLFAALLAAASNDCDGDGGHLVEVSPSSILAAMKDYERLTGRKPDDFLSESLLKWIKRDSEINLSEEQKVNLGKFLPPSAAQH